ncbi:MAG: HD domain-containing protein [Desulfovibrionaceae bacterium]|nr:HD domain-containing protein [Desulfovibrionaceae bacterium]
MNRSVSIPKAVSLAVQRLGDNGYASHIVGGAVRDYLCKRPIHDWDLVTDAPIETIRTIFSDFRCLAIGVAHGIMTVLIDDLPIEISTYRGDEPGLVMDLAKRDFTINAMAYSQKDGIIDPFGGQNDLQAGRIRAVVSPQDRFQEDPLRILRCLRFASELSMRIEPETEAAMQRVSLDAVAVERLASEMTKMLVGPGIRDVLLAYPGILARVIPEINKMIGFQQRNPYHRYDVWRHTVEVVAHTPADPVLRWAALFHDMGKPDSYTCDANGIGHFYGHGDKSYVIACRTMRRLKMSNAWQETIAMLVKKHDLTIPVTYKGVKKLLYREGYENLQMLIPLFEADCAGQSELSAQRMEDIQNLKRNIEKIREENACFSRKDLALSGFDLMRLGFEGRALGDMLQNLVYAVAVDGLPNTREDLLAFVEKQHS